MAQETPAAEPAPQHDAPPDDGTVLRLLENLSAAAPQLIRGLDALTQDSGRQFVRLARSSRLNRRLIWGLAVSLILDVLLTVGLAVSFSRVDALTERLDYSQTTTRRQVLCPLYELLVETNTPANRARAADKAAYDRQYATLQRAYAVLSCGTVAATPTPGTPPPSR